MSASANNDLTVSYVIATCNICTISSKSKLELLKSFVYSNHVDVILLQEVAITDFSFLSGYNSVVNMNENKRGTAILMKDTIHYTDVRLLESSRGISLKINNTRLVNIYAPSGSQSTAQREEFFSGEICNLMQIGEDLILGGDFNCVIFEDDCKNFAYNKSKKLASLVNAFGLIDVWKYKKPQVRDFYTYFHLNSASRIDRFYVSRHNQEKVGMCSLHVAPFSDHRAVIVNYKCKLSETTGFFRGRGFWKLNNSLLQNEEMVGDFERNWQLWLRAKPRYNSVVVLLCKTEDSVVFKVEV